MLHGSAPDGNNGLVKVDCASVIEQAVNNTSVVDSLIRLSMYILNKFLNGID